MISILLAKKIAKLYGRLTNATEVERASIIYSNGGNLIVPIVGSVLGDEWVVYFRLITNIEFNFYKMVVKTAYFIVNYVEEGL